MSTFVTQHFTYKSQHVFQVPNSDKLFIYMYNSL